MRLGGFVMLSDFLPAFAAAAALGTAMIAIIVSIRQAAAVQSLRLLAEQNLAGTRAEAETTRAAFQAGMRDLVDRLGTVRAGSETGVEQIRTVLSRGQGDLRLALSEAQRAGAEETRRQFEATRTMIETRLQDMRAGNEVKLSEIRKTVDEQLHAAVEKQMTESFNRVIDQFAAVQKAMGDVRAVTDQIGDLKRLFSNVRTRGGWGESQVRAMLDDILPPGSYRTNCKIRGDSDEAVEFAVLMPMRGDERPLLPIDAKFPVEDYERLLAASESGDPEAERSASRGLERRVRDEARKIATKYIHPPATVEFAVLYVPTDALYAEIARIPGLIDDIGRDSRVLVMGPTLFPALLRTIHLGFVTLALERNANQVRDVLSATRAEIIRMDEVLGRLAKQAGTFGNTIERARQRTRAVGRKLHNVAVIEPEKAEMLLGLEDEMSEEDSGDCDPVSSV